MNIYRVLPGVCLVFVIFTYTPAFAIDLQHGMHGLPWACSASQYTYLTKVRESNQVVYYVNSNMIYQVINQSVNDVFYGFYKDQFFAVYIKLRSRDQFDHLKELFSKYFGKPRFEKNALDQQEVYRWKNGDVKIKVKMKESIGDIKLAVYYAPISAMLNEEHPERIEPDTFIPATTKEGKGMKPAPLLDE